MSELAHSPLTDHRPVSKSQHVTVGLVSIGVFTGIGWLVGVLFLWTSKAWTRRDRLIGTLVPILGILLVYLCPPLWTAEEVCRNTSSGRLVCSGGPTELGESLFGAAVILPPLLTGILLARSLRRRQTPAAQS